MVNTIKFSEMTDGGDLANNEKTPGLLSGANVLFNNPWTFLAPGTTGERPIPAVAMYYRLRLNTTLEVYEYYDPTIPIWVELSGSGTGTVNPGIANDIAFYAAAVFFLIFPAWKAGSRSAIATVTSVTGQRPSQPTGACWNCRSAPRQATSRSSRRPPPLGA